jgi:cell division protein FtsQ
MKQWLKITLWSLFGLTVIAGLYFTQKAQGQLVLATPDVKIHVHGENSFITERELLDSLRHEALIYEGQRREQLDIEGVELYLEGISQVKDVKVYSMLGRNWSIDVETRKPIARIFNNAGETFYLDSDGETMEISRDHAARTLVVTGDIPDRLGGESVPEIINNDTLKSIRKLDDIYRISDYVCNDPLFRSLVGQIHLKSNGDFVLIPLVGDQKIIFGSAYTEKEVTEKFKKLRIFYKEAMPYEGWETYTEISLKYEDQIVCKRKKETNG